MKLLRAAVLIVPLQLAAQAVESAVPGTPAGRQVSAFLGAFNSADRAVLQRFFEANAPSQIGRLDQVLGSARRTGGYDYKKTVASTETALTGLVQEKGSDQFASITVEVEPAGRHAITRIAVGAVDRPAEFAVRRMSEPELVSALRARLAESWAAGRFSGSVLVSKRGATVFSGAVGYADRDKRIPNSLDTRFRNGSMNKMFTAVAVLQLVQAGKIDLNAPLGRYLTDYPNKDVASRVTIHHLLTHTGGTGDFFGPEFSKHRLELRNVSDYLELFGSRGLLFDPGVRFAYSNYGFVLLGAVIEKVSGMNYYDYMRERIYKPAGMLATGSEPETENVPNRSIGYMRSPGDTAARPNHQTLPWRGMPAGGGYSTVGDFERFARALIENRLLNAHYTELLTTGKVDAFGGKYAYGFIEQTSGGVRRIGHGGGAPGMNGDLAIFPKSGYVVVVLSNFDPPAASVISDFITNRLPLTP